MTSVCHSELCEESLRSLKNLKFKKEEKEMNTIRIMQKDAEEKLSQKDAEKGEIYSLSVAQRSQRVKAFLKSEKFGDVGVVLLIAILIFLLYGCGNDSKPEPAMPTEIVSNPTPTTPVELPVVSVSDADSTTPANSGPTTTIIVSDPTVSSPDPVDDPDPIPTPQPDPIPTPKWMLAQGTGIQSSDLNKTTGEIYSVTSGTNPSIVKFNTDGTIAWTKPVQVPNYAVWSVDFLRLSPDGNMLYLFWRKYSQIYSTGGGIFISGFDPKGIHIWTKEIDDVTGIPQAITVDNTSVYIVAVVTFYNDSGVFRIDSSGKLIWQISISPETGGTFTGFNSAFVSNGRIYITGSVGGNFSGFIESGGRDLYVAEYDILNGNRIGVSQWSAPGSKGSEDGHGIAVIQTGSNAGIYVAGATACAGLTNVSETCTGPSKILVQKYDFNRNLQWSKNDYVSVEAVANAIVADENGLYVIGSHLMKLNFDGTMAWPQSLDFGIGNWKKDVAVFNGVIFTSSYMSHYFSRYDAATRAKLQ